MNLCNNCGCETNNPKYCSRSCSAKVNGREFPKRKVERKCTKCDKLAASYKTLLCKDHLQEWKDNLNKDKTIGEYRNKLSVKGKHASWLNSHVRIFTRNWLKHLRALPCAKCGYDLHVELAHIRQVSSYTDDTKLSEVNSEDNVIQLCPNCHWEFDNLPRKGLFTDLLRTNNKKFDNQEQGCNTLQGL